jgi:hypothetical protein
MSDGTPTAPAEIAVARELLAAARQELGLLVSSGVEGLATAFASAAASEAQLGGVPEPPDLAAVEVVEYGGTFILLGRRAGRPMFGVVLDRAEAMQVAHQLTEALNRSGG